MSQPNKSDDLLQLLDALCNARLDAEQRERLQSLLRDDAVAQRTYFAYIDLHVGLQHIAGVESERGVPAPIADAPVPATRGHHFVFRAALAASLLVATGLTVAIFILMNSPPTRLPMNLIVKQLAGKVEVQQVDGTPRAAKVGMVISAGERIETKGPQTLAVVAYDDGSQLLIVGESAVTFSRQNGKRVTVRRGTISASVKPQPSRLPMVIETPEARVDVLGTEFVLSAAEHHTDLKVTKGRVKLTRTTDGEAVVVNEGKRIITGQQVALTLQDAGPPPERWDADFEDGLPADWQSGEFVTDSLPVGSKGAVKAVDVGDSYSIDGPHAWMDGLFVVHADSHLNMTYKMARPDWINIFFITRANDSQDPMTTLHKFDALPFRPAEPNVWRTVSIPLSKFQRKTNNEFRDVAPKVGELAFGIAWTAPGPDRGLVIDRVWVTRGGSGKVVSKKVE